MSTLSVDLAGRGILKAGSTKSTNTRKPQQQHHAVSHSSVLPIGISSRELVRPILPCFNAAGVDKSGIGYLLVRRFAQCTIITFPQQNSVTAHSSVLQKQILPRFNASRGGTLLTIDG